MSQTSTTAEAPEAQAKAPVIGEPWPGQGGIYAGVSRGEEGQPDAHLILCLAEPERLAWKKALEWATALDVDGHKDFHVPTRFESALLYAHLRDQFEQSAWYWTSTQYSSGSAFDQFFTTGYQGYYVKHYEGRVRAVRRFTA